MTDNFSEKEHTAGKKVWIKTYGCQMNVYDSERMQTIFKEAGYGEASLPDEADVIVLNTCHIREKAAEKVYSEVGRLRALKAQNPNLKIAVAGCVAQAEGEEILKRAPTVDLVLGPQSYHRLPEHLEKNFRKREDAVVTDFSAEEKFTRLEQNASRVFGPKRVTSFVTIQEGCDKFCTFCVVPYTRGAEFSRPVANIRQEVVRLVDQGVKEITLLGQNVNAYHGLDAGGTPSSLGRLLEVLSEISGLERLRYTTSHPNEMTDDLIAQHRDNPKVMPYLHLPVQSGSDRILKAMNRRHTAQAYRALIARIRDARPDIALSGDFIVGFPSETDDDFEKTLALAKDISYANAYSFKYSPRLGTKAAEAQDQVPEEIKSDRLARLQEVLHHSQVAFNRSFLGKRMLVLLEKPGRHPGQWVGRSPYLQAVHIDGFEGAEMGALIEVEITAVAPHSLEGRRY